MEIVEQIREKLHENIYKDFRNFRKVRHFMEEEDHEYLDMELEVFEQHENLQKKATYTQLTPENFMVWNLNYLKKIEAKTKKVVKKSKWDMKKPTGREIFQDSSNLLFIDDNGQESESDPDVDVDENIFAEGDLEMDMDELDGLEDL